MEQVRIKFDYEKYLNLARQADNVIISDGLSKHLIKRNHENMLRYIPQLSEILNQPDFIGRNPKQPESSFECIKVLDDNVLVAVKLDVKSDYYFVASMYDVTDDKLRHMEENGRVIRLTN